MGAELFHSFPKAFEGSVGMRTLFFGSSDVTIYTGSVGKYISNYWISLRSYVTPGSDGTSVFRPAASEGATFLIRRITSDYDWAMEFRLTITRMCSTEMPNLG